MDQMPTRDHLIPETMGKDLSHSESRAIFERNTQRGGIVLILLSVSLTGLAVGMSLPFIGFVALMTVFIGGAWLSYRLLLARWAKFRNLPITKLNRM